MNPYSTAHYSYSWAYGVVETLERKYARAAIITYKLLGIDTKILAKYLANGDPIYPQIRDFMHRVDKIDKFARPKPTMSEFYSFMSKYYPRNQSKRIGERLTAIHNGQIIEEQLNKGGESEAQADDSLPFLDLNSEVSDYGHGAGI